VGSIKSYVESFDARLSWVNTASPKVSIIVTNYNYSDYICDCLQSVSVQSYPEIECIVVDDHSSDDSAEKIKNFIASDTSHVKFTLVTHASTRGQYAAFRTGVEHADGAFVSFLDADDLLLPDFVSEHVRVHLTLPPVALTSSNQYQIDAKGQVIGGVHPDLHTHRAYRMAGTIALQRPFWIWATTSSMMFRRTVLGYVLSDADDAFKKCADNYVAHFCHLLGGSILIPGLFGCYRRHQRNTFSNNPLIGGRLPTGDMGNHPAHHTVLQYIRARLLECGPQFISLLGGGGFLSALVKVTPINHLWPSCLALRRVAGFGVRQQLTFCYLFALLGMKKMARVARGRHPGLTLHDVESTKRVPIVTNYAGREYPRRDAK
jgi:glycosyltransferase involved in cell wall biosynthesis